MPSEIVQVGHPVLRGQARPLSPGEIRGRKIHTLIDRMRSAMQQAPGVGLAAPQIAMPLQLAVIEDRAEYHKEASAAHLAERGRRPVPFHAVINPVIVDRSAETAEFFEGCLSLPGFSALVPRALRVTVECLDERGEKKVIEASGWYARILQHEIDHLGGMLYLDRMLPRSFTSMDNWAQFWKDKGAREIRAALDCLDLRQDGAPPGTSN